MEFMFLEIPVALLKALAGSDGPPRELAAEDVPKFKAYAKAVMGLAVKGVSGEALFVARRAGDMFYQIVMSGMLDAIFEHFERDLSVEDSAAELNRLVQQQKDESLRRRDEALLANMPDDGKMH